MQLCFSKTHSFIKRNCVISILKEGAFKYFSYDFLDVGLHKGKNEDNEPKVEGFSKSTFRYV